MASIYFISTYFLLQNSSDFEICSLMWDNDIMLNNKFIPVLGRVVYVEY